MSTASKPIICCGFTPCLQRVLTFEKFEKGRVNRAESVRVGLGGKGANVARMLKQLGGNPVLLGFAGGLNGKRFSALLKEYGVAHEMVWVSGETRICETLVEAGNPEPTELVEEMPAISPLEWEKMVQLFRSLNLKDAVVPIAGKLPAGAPVDGYAQLCEVVCEKGGRVVLDTSGEPLLSALRHRPFMVKLNREELFSTVGIAEMFEACNRVLSLGAESVLVTDGAKKAFYVSKSAQLEITPPVIDAVNPVGSGDAVTAGMSKVLSEGGDLRHMLVEGMACGAANALNLVSGSLKMRDVEWLRESVRVVPF